MESPLRGFASSPRLTGGGRQPESTGDPSAWPLRSWSAGGVRGRRQESAPLLGEGRGGEGNGGRRGKAAALGLRMSSRRAFPHHTRLHAAFSNLNKKSGGKMVLWLAVFSVPWNVCWRGGPAPDFFFFNPVRGMSACPFHRHVRICAAIYFLSRPSFPFLPPAFCRPCRSPQFFSPHPFFNAGRANTNGPEGFRCLTCRSWLTISTESLRAHPGNFSHFCRRACSVGCGRRLTITPRQRLVSYLLLEGGLVGPVSLSAARGPGRQDTPVMWGGQT